ncbi:putative tetratricopeptide repeat-containing Zn-dependent protease [Rickettsiales endosymbiont of Paramecium tredecaurelia]|uniref:M48 family metalloprotease n=1 Tax=Candidatus Sarmatiella mevalonica TaxID=2770581 RepID=UPI0019217284|nr:M48 family metalloprotease [Candidatus Sarmatiella mevalonica]MBL3284923.1 putative tetratricopeptide repeat-containing Zn-dependent protease [Candidatus Sarmatiella mevalonica]
MKQSANLETNLKNLFSLFILCIPLLFLSQAKGDFIIHDAEIESLIHDISSPIIQKAGLPEVKIYVNVTPQVNAFATSNSRIVLYSGLIARMNADALRAVIAHEIGHIKAQHISKNLIKQNELNKMYGAGMLSAILVGALLSAGGSYSSADAAGAMHQAIGSMCNRSMLQHSRTQEIEADQIACKLLQEAGYDSSGLMYAMNYFKVEQNTNNAHKLDPYELTHPMAQERIEIIKNYSHNTKQFEQRQGNCEELNYRLQRVIAKLLFIQLPPTQLQDAALKQKNEEIRQYMQSMYYLKVKNHQKSLYFIDSLLSQKPSDPYYNLLKGEILLDFGKAEALNFYEKALQLKPNDKWLKIDNAVAAIRLSNNKQTLERHGEALRQIVDRECDDDLVDLLYYTGIYYEKIDKPVDSMYYLAIFYNKMGDFKKAKTFAKSAMLQLPQNSSKWIKLDDLLQSQKQNNDSR